MKLANSNSMQKYKYIDKSLIIKMRSIVNERGEKIINNKIFINILEDLDAFEDSVFLKNILKIVQKEKITEEMLNIQSWEMNSKK